MFKNIRITSLLLFSFLSQFVLSAELVSYKFSLQTKYGEIPMEIHFKPSDKNLAIRVEEIAKNDLIKVVEYFQYAPNETIHFNINSNMRLSNGNARTFPINVINLYNFPANNQDHLTIMEDWWRGLIIHEFTHVIHLDHTRDYTAVGKRIFGTIAKLPPQIVPRWFTEGIAVYAESKFNKSGRLYSQLLNKELLLYFNNEKSCKTIDCIDEPGKFPNGQLAYWIGGQFINYVEELKAGTIKCLVEDSSGRIPFFLNRSFQNCTDQSVYDLYEKFVQDFIAKNKSEGRNDTIENYRGIVNYQKGFALKDNRFFRVEREKKNEYLVATDLEANVTMAESYSHPISDISNFVKLDEDTEGLLVAFNDDFNFKKSNKVWKIINTETLEEEAVLNFEQDPSYAFAHDKIIYGAFTYKNNHWNFKQVQFALGKPYTVKEANLPESMAVNAVLKLKEKYILKVTNVNDQKTTLIIANLDLSNAKIVYQGLKFFEIFGRNENSFILKEGDTYTQYFVNGEKIEAQALEANQFKNSTFVLADQNLEIELNQILSWKKVNAYLAIGNKTDVTLSDWVIESNSTTKEINTIAYPRLEHFIPKYWFLSAGTSTTVSSLGAMTSFSDPEEIHNFTISGLYFPDISKAGGNFNYVYDGDPKGFDLTLNRDYNSSDVNSTVVNETSKLDLNFRYTIEKKRFKFIPSFLFGIDSNNDFISKRTTKYLGGRITVNYLANTYADTVQSVSLISRFAIDTPSGNESYGNFQNKAEAWFKITNELLLQSRFSSGKLFKSDFRRGVLFGGGYNSIQNLRWFEFYGINYGNAYGNEILTSRLKLDYSLLDYYRGHNLIPFFLRELHLILGYENLKADVIYQDKKYFSDEFVHSLFGGVKLKTLMFYLVPTDFDLIISGTKLPDNSIARNVIVAISAGLF